MISLVAVLTYPSKRDRFIDKTLADLDREGAAGVRKMVFCDGPAVRPDGRPFECPWPITVFPKQSGTCAALWQVFRETLKTDAEQLLFFEDDVYPAVDAVTKALAEPVPDDCAFVSFFTYREVQKRAPDGRYKIPVHGTDGRGLWGSQALLLPRRALEFVTQKEPREWGDPFRGRPNHGDSMLSWVMWKFSKWPYHLQVHPSLFEHEGAGAEASSLKQGHSPAGRATRFAGGR